MIFIILSETNTMKWVSIYHYPDVAKYELQSGISGLNFQEHSRYMTLNKGYANAVPGSAHRLLTNP
jgi:hypothetical protein